VVLFSLICGCWFTTTSWNTARLPSSTYKPEMQKLAHAQTFCRGVGCGWSRAYVYKSNPHRGWILDLILSTLSMEVKGALLLCFRGPARPLSQVLSIWTFMSMRCWLRGKFVYCHYFFKWPSTTCFVFRVIIFFYSTRILLQSNLRWVAFNVMRS